MAGRYVIFLLRLLSLHLSLFLVYGCARNLKSYAKCSLRSLAEEDISVPGTVLAGQTTATYAQ